MSAEANQNVRDAIQRVAHTEPDGARWLDFFGDQHDVQAIGEAIAASVADLPVDAILTWFHPDETVLGHVVATCLGVKRGAIEEDLGLLTLMPSDWQRSRVVVVASQFPMFRGADVVQSVVEGAGHEYVASVALSVDDGIVVERAATQG